MTSTPSNSSRRSALLGRSVGLALGAALAAGVLAPAAASASPAGTNVEPAIVHAAHRTTTTTATHRSTTTTHRTTTPAAATHAAGTSGKPRVSRPVARPVARPAAVPGVALSADEARILVLLNAQRVAHHLVPLVAAAGPTDVARRWSDQLAAAGTLSHNPDLVPQLQSAGGGQWTWLAENVGVAPAGETDQLFAAYMASPHHRANILDPRARFVGLGTVTDSSGTSWNTMDFIDSYSTSYGAARTQPAS